MENGRRVEMLQLEARCVTSLDVTVFGGRAVKTDS
eukprot:SAG31_NODE_25317_length_463_cov_1.780220_1_plen_34_part_01